MFPFFSVASVSYTICRRSALSAGSDVKAAYLEALKAAGGEPTEEKVMALMEELCGTYKGLSKPLVESHSGHWVTVSNYFGPQVSCAVCLVTKAMFVLTRA